MRLTRALLAAPLGAVLAAGVWSGTAVAADPEPPGLVADLCAAADIGQVNALLSANVDVGLPAGVRDAVDPTVAGGTLDEVQSRLGCAEQPPAEDTTEPGANDPGTDQPGDDDTGTGTDTPPADEPAFDNCVDAIAAGSIQPATRGVDPSYQEGLDVDGDGVSCEAGEATGGPAPGTGDDSTGTGSGSGDGSGTLGGNDSSGSSGSVDSIPRGSVDTGYAPR